MVNNQNRSRVFIIPAGCRTCLLYTSQMEWVCDAKDADVNPENYIKEIINIPSNRKLVVKMAQGCLLYTSRCV